MNPYSNFVPAKKRLEDNRESIDTIAFQGRQVRGEELKARNQNEFQNQTILDSLQSRGNSRGNMHCSAADFNGSGSDVGCMSPRSVKNLDYEVPDSSTKKKLMPIGQDPEEKRQFEKMRIGYLQSQSLLSSLCCSKALRCLNLDQDRYLEIVMF